MLSDLLQIPEDVPVDYMHAILEGSAEFWQRFLEINVVTL